MDLNEIYFFILMMLLAMDEDNCKNKKEKGEITLWYRAKTYYLPSTLRNRIYIISFRYCTIVIKNNNSVFFVSISIFLMVLMILVH
jgi:hypothetical protein